jgi:hypothetical protein
VAGTTRPAAKSQPRVTLRRAADGQKSARPRVSQRLTTLRARGPSRPLALRCSKASCGHFRSRPPAAWEAGRRGLTAQALNPKFATCEVGSGSVMSIVCACGLPARMFGRLRGKTTVAVRGVAVA